MAGRIAVDAGKLEKDARAARDGEAFAILRRDGGCRVGVGARRQDPPALEFFIEISIPICGPGCAVEPAALLRAARAVQRLAKLGYAFCCTDGEITCEKTVDAESLQSEACRAQAAINA